MTRSASRTGFAIPILVLLVALAGGAEAGEFSSQSTFGGNFLFSSPPCPVRQFPTFESLTPVPHIIDPFEEDLIPMFCDIQVSREGKGVRGARGKFDADLVVIDNDSGLAESFPIKSGRFRTNPDGVANFDFELPAELFADGFESGDVSAWSYTRTDFTNRKKVDQAQVVCSSSASKSNNN